MDKFLLILAMVAGSYGVFKSVGYLSDHRTDQDFEHDLSFLDDYITEGDTRSLPDESLPDVDPGKEFYSKDEIRQMSDQEVVARTVYGEGRGSNATEWEWIIQTIKNRKESPHYPNSYKGVCLAPFQFSPWNENSPMTVNQREVRRVNIRSQRVFNRIRQKVEEVMSRRYTPSAQRKVYNFLTDRADKPDIQVRKGVITSAYVRWAEGMAVAYKGDHYFLRRR